MAWLLLLLEWLGVVVLVVLFLMYGVYMGQVRARAIQSGGFAWLYTPKHRSWPTEEVQTHLRAGLASLPLEAYRQSDHYYVVADGIYKIHALYLGEPSYDLKKRVDAAFLEHQWVPIEGRGNPVAMVGYVNPFNVRRYEKGPWQLTFLPGGVGGFVIQLGDRRCVP